MRTIAISLCDNDFGQTFPPLLESIYAALVFHENQMTREHVEACIREGIKFHYIAYHSDYDGKDIDGTMKYLEKIKVLFDEDAEKHIETHDHDGGSWYLEVATGKVYSY